MDERCFPNPYADYSAGSVQLLEPDGKLHAGLAGRIRAALPGLLKQVEDGQRSESGHDYSIYTGSTGISLLYLHLAQVFKDDGYLKKALDWVQPGLKHLKRKRLTFLCGDAGPLAVGAVVYHRLGLKEAQDSCLSKLQALGPDALNLRSDLPDELLYGRAGYLYALRFVRKNIGDHAVDEKLVDKVAQAIVSSGQALSKQEKSSSPLKYMWHGKHYVGAAHGMAGIYYQLMQTQSAASQAALPGLVKPSVDYLRKLQFPSGNYPSSLGNTSDRLVHWCHGAPGAIYMLMAAYQVFRDQTYLDEAKRCAEVIWRRGLLKKGYGICHGAAGNGYAFLSMYRLTNDEVYLYRAVKFAEWCLDYGKHGCRVPDRPFSLFEGLAGAAYFLADVLNPGLARFPAFEL
ncbi:PREDICTED: lanC-like protein 2 [Branchiostoma belcheri]|uniref:LanC-like protein 2 n=1 Tax=Branchiostoma belcheri TaxID=7741 RepID=A0A6P4ZVT0_BRABE|nr:PREDICTED: lanC-like protein 2 [Branchiostoma belcheri]KAI8514687.1 Glutathione S-transferase lancl1 [Branchiostoma belcheri]